MNFLINTQEEVYLKRFLALAANPDLSFTPYEVCGYLFGLAITPETIPAEEWIQNILGKKISLRDIPKEQEEIFHVLFTVCDRYKTKIALGEMDLPFDVDEIGAEDLAIVEEWVAGIEEALTLRSEYWEEENAPDDEDKEALANALIVIEGIVYPEESLEMFENLSEKEREAMGMAAPKNQEEMFVQIQLVMLRALDLAIHSLIRHAVLVAVQKEQQLDPFEQHKKRGELIKVDFSQGRKCSENSEMEEDVEDVCYQLEIRLLGIHPQVLRLVQVPALLSLEDLHLVVQVVMGWDNIHTHAFTIDNITYGPDSEDQMFARPDYDEEDILLLALEDELRQGIAYTYDFSDRWQHSIRLQKIMRGPEDCDALSPVPLLLSGEGACPPESFGGPEVYQNFLVSLDNPITVAGDSNLFPVAKVQDFDPKYFPEKEIAYLLRKIFGHGEGA